VITQNPGAADGVSRSMTVVVKPLGIVLILALALLVGVVLLGGDEGLKIETEEASPAEKRAPPKAERMPFEGARLIDATGTRSEVGIATIPFEEVPPWQARYGPLLERGEARARFEVLDAAGQPLEWSDYLDGKAQLWRKVGAYYLKQSVKVDRGRDAVSCEGLEPGEYLLELSIGDYGVARHTFALGKGDVLVERLSMPGHARTITLLFVTPDGTPIMNLDGVPTFVRGPSASLPMRGSRPRTVLRSPPSPWNRAIGIGGGGGSGFRSGRSGSRRIWRTDAGRFTIKVIAGRPGTVRMYGWHGLFKRRLLEVRGDFTGSEWDRHTVVLHPADDTEERLRGRAPANRANPGRTSSPWIARYSRFLDQEPEEDPFDLRGLENSGHSRLGLHFPEPELFRPRVYWLRGSGTSLARRSPVSGTTPVVMKRVGGVFYGDVGPRDQHALAIGDGAFLRLEARPLLLSDQPLVSVHPKLNIRPVTVRLRSSPTLAAFGRVVTVALIPDAGKAALRWHWTSRPARHVEPDLHEIRTFISGSEEDGLDAGGRIVVCYGNYLDAHRKGLRLDAGKVRPQGRGTRQFVFPLTQARIEGLRAGKIVLDMSQAERTGGPRNGLVLRAVGPAGEGLPWVEATLISEEDDALARGMLDIAQRLTRDERRNEVEQRWVAKLPEVGPEPTATDAEIARILGKQVVGEFSSKEMRRRLYRQGAWYDSHHKGKTDEDGFLFLRASHLIPGRRFTLYLWSGSRNDLEPDCRVVFQAAPGLVDLGVIRLPSP